MILQNKMRAVIDRKAARREGRKIVNDYFTKTKYYPNFDVVAKAIIERAEQIHSSGADVIVAPLTGAELICRMAQKVIKKKYRKKIPVVEWEKDGRFDRKGSEIIRNAKNVFVLDDATRGQPGTKCRTQCFVHNSINHLNPNVHIDYNFLSTSKAMSAVRPFIGPVPLQLRGFGFSEAVSSEKVFNTSDYYQLKYNIGILHQLLPSAKGKIERERLTRQLKEELILLEAYKEYKRRLQNEISKQLAVRS